MKIEAQILEGVVWHRDRSFDTVVEELPVEVHYDYHPAERAIVFGPIEVCHPGTDSEVSINSVLFVRHMGGRKYLMIDLLPALNEETLEKLREEIDEYEKDEL